MTGHMALPQLTAGDSRPASLAREITTDLLRGEMAYEGVIVTDCLEMEAVASAPGGVEQGAVSALQAGADIVMICHRMDRQSGAIRAAWDAVRSGACPIAELDRSAERVRKLKDRFAGTWEDYESEDLTKLGDEARAMKEVHVELSERVYRASTALVRDPLGVIPLSPVSIGSSGKVLLLTPRPGSLNAAVDDPAVEGTTRTADGKVRNTAGPSYLALGASIARRLEGGTAVLEHAVYSKESTVEDILSSSSQTFSALIFATRNAHASGSWQLELLERLLASPQLTAGPASTTIPTILLATCTPYECAADLAKGLACIATFEFTPPAFDIAVGAIFGKFTAVGKVPVTLD